MPQPLKILTSGATKEFLRDIAGQFARDTGVAVEIESAGGVDVARRARAGEKVDGVALSAEVIDTLVKEGVLAAGSRVDIATSGIAVAVRKGAPRPDLGSAEALRQAIVAAKSVGYSTGPSGRYLEKLFADWGIREAIASRIVQAPPGVPVGTFIARGEVELGFQQLSELVHLPGIDIAGPLPAGMQVVTTFAGGVMASSPQPEAAKAAFAYFASPRAREALRTNGLEAA